MFFRQILHADLGCASYLIADGGEAAVIDPKWEIEDYLQLAGENDFQVTHILETHNHADHVSGRGRLHEATGATIHLSAEAGVAYEHEPLADGDAIEFGEVRIVARPTPGHRPEHTAYAVEDRSRGETPWLLLTGDSLFVGDIVTRPRRRAGGRRRGGHALGPRIYGRDLTWLAAQHTGADLSPRNLAHDIRIALGMTSP